ncbi:MAG: NRDE family protein [Sphingobacteriaceae bacterium]|nr:NRDE family protein [Sphingobacteriaceae bacterium]
MCTVSFLPVTTAGLGFIFTSNRDETSLRPAALPSWQVLPAGRWFGPSDPLSKGSWFGTDGERWALCVLNGAFVKHQHQPPYSRSRGRLIPDFLTAGSTDNFLSTYDFAGMEPFTFLIVQFGESPCTLLELRWDAHQLHQRYLSADQPHLWSSATLYNAEQAAIKKQWFNVWLAQQEGVFTQEAIFRFHQEAGIGDPGLDLVMNRGTVRTTSISSLALQNNTLQLRYLQIDPPQAHAYSLF